MLSALFFCALQQGEKIFQNKFKNGYFCYYVVIVGLIYCSHNRGEQRNEDSNDPLKFNTKE